MLIIIMAVTLRSVFLTVAGIIGIVVAWTIYTALNTDNVPSTDQTMIGIALLLLPISLVIGGLVDAFNV
jgi:hypothetical protein